MVVEHAHGLRQRRGPNAKSSLHKAHLAPDAGLQAPGASLSFAQGSHDFDYLDRGIGSGGRFETAHRLDQYLELSVIGLDHVDRKRVVEGNRRYFTVDLGSRRSINTITQSDSLT